MDRNHIFHGADYDGKLILGESSYQSKLLDQWKPDYRKRFMDNWVKQPRTPQDDNYFEGNVTCMLANLPPMEVVKSEVWRGYATENYINDVLKPYQGEFTSENWNSAARRFPQLVRVMEPTHIVCCGTGLTNEIRRRFRSDVALTTTMRIGEYDHPIYSLRMADRKLLLSKCSIRANVRTSEKNGASGATTGSSGIP